MSEGKNDNTVTIEQMCKLFNNGVKAGEDQAVQDTLNGIVDSAVDMFLDGDPDYKDPYDVGFKLGYLTKAL